MFVFSESCKLIIIGSSELIDTVNSSWKWGGKTWLEYSSAANTVGTITPITATMRRTNTDFNSFFYNGRN